MHDPRLELISASEERSINLIRSVVTDHHMQSLQTTGQPGPHSSAGCVSPRILLNPSLSMLTRERIQGANEAKVEAFLIADKPAFTICVLSEPG